MNNPSAIEAVVMRRVRLIRILALVLSTATLAVLTFIAALWGIGREVWVAKVFANGPQDVVGHALYLAYAFGHTRPIVQVLTLLTLASLLFLVRELAKFISNALTPTHA